MTNEKWEEIVLMVQKNFKGAKLSTEDLVEDSPEGPVKQGTQDVLEFSNSSGHFKLVRENRPMILEKKELYSTRAGQSAQILYKKSETEFSHKLRVFKEEDFDEWEEVTLDSLGI
jgi:hypothetical protein